MSTVRTRFAPSPTGYMHVGNLRTALYTWLIARRHHGKFILRIEDTDQGRLVEGAVDVIYKTMAECGLDHDEGPDVGGPVGVARIIYFDFDSYTVKPEFQSLIEAHSRFLKANPNRKVVIEGHTDERGGREYNLALGQRRSEAVRRSMGLLGVKDNEVEAVSFGKEKPAAQGSDEAAMAQNRRAEVSYR